MLDPYLDEPRPVGHGCLEQLLALAAGFVYVLAAYVVICWVIGIVQAFR